MPPARPSRGFPKDTTGVRITAPSSQPFADMSRPKRQDEEKIDVDSVFAKLKQLKRPADDEDDDGGY